MEPQSYKNHIRYYTPHHFVFYPVMLVLIAVSAWLAFTKEESLLWGFMCVLCAVITWVAYMMRQHYALTVQNRIVLLELRYRFFAKTGERFEMYETMLNDGQLFAVRFASDDELLPLIQKAINENLSPDDIKKAIQNWQPDHRRV